MAQSITTDGGESDGMNIDGMAASLAAQQTAEGLRRLAAHSDKVSRPRGARKAETAEAITEQDPEFAKTVIEGGDCSVQCSCGLDYSVDDPQVARRAAKQHKSARITHFPKAKDEDVVLYG